jgi:HD-GYP domain-containing protein (c-di-GMP phosphodiesterase class II)
LLKQAEDGMYRDKLINGSAFKKRVVDILINSFYEKGVHEQSHSQTVGFICREIGKAMNLDITTLDNLYLSGVLHDIGKITLEEEVLNKVGALDEHEKVAMMRHPEIGFNILRTIQGFGRVAEWVLMHHEQPDGKGYPQQLPDEEIPLESKIISVATAYATMTASTRRLQLQTHQEALREIEFYASSKFDERVVKVLSSMKIDRLLRREERRIQKEQKQSAD